MRKLFFITVISAAATMTACRTMRSVEYETSVSIDTVKAVLRAADTLWIHDKEVYVLGPDSSLASSMRERIIYRTREVHDTLYKSQTDTVRSVLREEVVAADYGLHRTLTGILWALAGVGAGVLLAVMMLLKFKKS